MTPYAVGIVEMPEGVKIPSIIRTARLEDLEIGMQLEADFSPRPQVGGWHNWPRYFLKENEIECNFRLVGLFLKYLFTIDILYFVYDVTSMLMLFYFYM